MSLLKNKSKSKPAKKINKPTKIIKKKKDTMEDQELEEQLEEINQPTMWDVIAPDGIKINAEDYGMIKQSLGTTTYFRPFYIPRDGYPRKMQTNWLYSITSSGEADVLVDVHKVGKTDAIRSLQRQLTMLESNLSFQVKRGNIDQINDLKTKIFDTEQLMSEIQFSENDIYNVATLGALYAQSEKELNHYSESIEDEMSGQFFKITSTWSRVKKGLRSVIPIGRNEISDSLRNIDRRALSTFSPFISGSGKYLGGVPLGINKITGQLEFINSFGNEDFRPQNYNIGITGIPGSGKSLAMKLKIAREKSGANVFASIIDPEGEFVSLTKRLGGINLNISEEEDICINPCAVSTTDILLEDEDEELDWLEDRDDKEVVEKEGKAYVRFVPLREKQNEILSFFDIIARGKNSEDQGLDVFERNYLEEAITFVFNELGITSHPSSLFDNKVVEIDGQLIQSAVRKPEPTISDIFSYLLDNYANDKRAARLIATIKPFLKDGSKPIFDGQTYLGKGVTQSLGSARLVNFNISQMEEGFLRPIAYHVILNYLWEYFAKNSDNATKKKYIYCDELWQFIDNEQTVSFFEKVARRARKRNCGLCWATQDFVRILENPKARGILSSTFTILFMQQNKIDLKKVKENFDLSDGEIDILFGNPDKGESILRIGKSSVWLQTNPSEDELTFIESNQAVLEEMLKRKKMNHG
ncbi:VirB4 family type IV secretion system protein [Metabacillus herbersteinensis]|uniref:VirB4 family type IV secretion system protein n=1 Tax=Metabacillus herbersteinensis TaxID=283816 RepID=A0ABV6GJ63_9BACI